MPSLLIFRRITSKSPENNSCFFGKYMILYWCQGEERGNPNPLLSGLREVPKGQNGTCKSDAQFAPLPLTKNSRILKKVLDNQHKMCYNDKAVRDRNPLLNKMGGEPTAEYERSLYD